MHEQISIMLYNFPLSNINWYNAFVRILGIWETSSCWSVAIEALTMELGPQQRCVPSILFAFLESFPQIFLMCIGIEEPHFLVEHNRFILVNYYQSGKYSGILTLGL